MLCSTASQQQTEHVPMHFPRLHCMPPTLHVNHAPSNNGLAAFWAFLLGKGSPNDGQSRPVISMHANLLYGCAEAQKDSNKCVSMHASAAGGYCCTTIDWTAAFLAPFDQRMVPYCDALQPTASIPCGRLRQWHSIGYTYSKQQPERGAQRADCDGLLQ